MRSAKQKAWKGRMLCKDIVVEILDDIESLMLSNICKDILLYTVMPETELRIETNLVMQNLAGSMVFSQVDRVRMRLINKKAEEDMSKMKMNRMKRKNTRELEWAKKKESMKYGQG